MANIDMKEYARRGALARLDELHAEIETIYGAFPDLRRRGGRAPARAGTEAPAARPAGRRGPRRGRKPMSAAQKKAVSQRMKRYWAARKKAEASKSSAR